MRNFPEYRSLKNPRRFSSTQYIGGGRERANICVLLSCQNERPARWSFSSERNEGLWKWGGDVVTFGCGAIWTSTHKKQQHRERQQWAKRRRKKKKRKQEETEKSGEILRKEKPRKWKKSAKRVREWEVLQKEKIYFIKLINDKQNRMKRESMRHTESKNNSAEHGKWGNGKRGEKKIMKINFRRVNKWQQILFNFIHGNVRPPVQHFSSALLPPPLSQSPARAIPGERERERMQTSKTEKFSSVTQCSVLRLIWEKKKCESETATTATDVFEATKNFPLLRIKMKSIYWDGIWNEWARESVETKIFILAFPI